MYLDAIYVSQYLNGSDAEDFDGKDNTDDNDNNDDIANDDVHAHTNVIDTLEVTCTTGNRNRATGLSAYPPNHKTIRSRLKVR